MYLIRHTRATELQKVLTGKIYEKFMDHSLQTATRYSHFKDKDVRDAMFKEVYDVEDITEEKKHELEIRIDNQQQQLKEQKKYIDSIEKAVLRLAKAFDKNQILEKNKG